MLEEEKQIKSFTIYDEYLDLIEILPEKEQDKIFAELIRYAFYNKTPKTLNKRQQAVFNNLKRPINKCINKSKNASSRWNNDNTNDNANDNAKEYANDNAKEDTQQVVDVNVYVNYKNIKDIIDFIETNYSKTISSYELKQISNLVELYGHDITYYAFQKTLDADKRSLNYTKGILKNWKDDNLTTLEEIKEKENVNKKTNLVPNWINKKIDSENNDLTINQEMQEFVKDFRNEKEK